MGYESTKYTTHNALRCENVTRQNAYFEARCAHRSISSTSAETAMAQRSRAWWFLRGVPEKGRSPSIEAASPPLKGLQLPSSWNRFVHRSRASRSLWSQALGLRS